MEEIINKLIPYATLGFLSYTTGAGINAVLQRKVADQIYSALNYETKDSLGRPSTIKFFLDALSSPKFIPRAFSHTLNRADLLPEFQKYEDAFVTECDEKPKLSHLNLKKKFERAYRRAEQIKFLFREQYGENKGASLQQKKDAEANMLEQNDYLMREVQQNKVHEVVMRQMKELMVPFDQR